MKSILYSSLYPTSFAIFSTVHRNTFLLQVVKMSYSAKRTPNDFLRQVLGHQVNVRLNNGSDYRGILACLDERMNIAMESTVEYLDGQILNQYGDTLIRGNNVLYISAVETSEL